MKKFEKDILANDKEWLIQKYYVELKSIIDIAKECGVSSDTINTRFKKFGLETRNHNESLGLKNKIKPNLLSREIRDKSNEKKKTGRYLVCKFCKKDFYCRKSVNRKYCSISCRNKYWKEHRKKNQDWRLDMEYRDWRNAVYKRDNWRCKICSSKRKINEHHIFEAQNFPELDIM